MVLIREIQGLAKIRPQDQKKDTPPKKQKQNEVLPISHDLGRGGDAVLSRAPEIARAAE